MTDSTALIKCSDWYDIETTTSFDVVKRRDQRTAVPMSLVEDSQTTNMPSRIESQTECSSCQLSNYKLQFCILVGLLLMATGFPRQLLPISNNKLQAIGVNETQKQELTAEIQKFNDTFRQREQECIAEIEKLDEIVREQLRAERRKITAETESVDHHLKCSDFFRLVESLSELFRKLTAKSLSELFRKLTAKDITAMLQTVGVVLLEGHILYYKMLHIQFSDIHYISGIHYISTDCSSSQGKLMRYEHSQKFSDIAADPLTNSVDIDCVCAAAA